MPLNESGRWSRSRYAALIAVSAGHLALLAWLLMPSPPAVIPAAPLQAVEVVYLPPVTPPKVRSKSAPPRRFTSAVAVSVSLPALASPLSAASPPAGPASDGNGSGVDWAAEARRALRAYEIRSRQPPSNNSVSGDQADVWLRQAHHAGDRLKTAGGDWIVWVDTRCYRVANAGPNEDLGSVLPPVTCPGQSATPDPLTRAAAHPNE
jgi:hypothetical protein